MANKGIKFSSLTALLTAIGNKVIKKSETVELTPLDIDSTPTSGSNNLVTSGGVAEYVKAPNDGRYTRTGEQWVKTELKTINSNSILGTGNISIKTLSPMKDEWMSDEITTAEAAELMLADGVQPGEGYLGTVCWKDLSTFGLGCAEVKAFVISDGIVQFEMTSSDTEPYAWFFNSAGGVWREYIPIADNLESDSTVEVLSAKQGKILNDGKVDKVTGKGLSTNDYTTEEKTKLAGLKNYDDTEIRQEIAGKQDALSAQQLQNIADVPNKAEKTPIDTKTAGQTSYAIDANKITKLGELASAVTLSLNAGESGKASIYDIIFSTGAMAPTITWPNGITWMGGSAPTINASKTYEVSISEGLALISEF